MNFFQAQDTARRKTWQLALMFGAAVVTLIVLTNLLVAVVFGWTGTQAGMTFSESLARVPADSWLLISVAIVLLFLSKYPPKKWEDIWEDILDVQFVGHSY